MANTHIKNDRTTQYTISTSDNVVVLDKGVSIVSQTNGINEMLGLTGNEINIEGTLVSHGMFNAALALQGKGTDVEIADSGKLRGESGVIVYGDDVSVVNRGRIQGVEEAIGVRGNNAHIVNHGSIIADDHAFLTNIVDTMRLDNSGLIRSFDGLDFMVKNLTLNFGKDSVVEFDTGGAIRTNSEAGWTATIRNSGTIMHDKVGMSISISGGMGEEIVRNRGTLTGFVDLEGGDDVYDGRGGRLVKGTVLGGDGNDTYYLDNSKDRVHESTGWGYDRLTVSASYRLDINNEMEETRLAGKGDFNLRGNTLGNYLEGNVGDNRLVGLAGNDAFYGGAGNDVMTGGDGIDTFYFKLNSDREVITDFTDGEDLLVLFTGDEIESVADLLANHAHQRGDDLVLSGDGTEMIIRNFDKANLTAADFTV